MMQLTMTGEYAVRAMVHLAGVPSGGIVQITDIAREWDIPESFLRKIIAKLSRAELVESRRGNGGGVLLAQDPNTLTLLDVIEAVEGKIALNKCMIAPGTCHRDPWCKVHRVWCKAQMLLRDTLSSSTLAQLALLPSDGGASHKP